MRGPALLAAIAIALSAALPAWSANVVDVRVGRHPEFTRVVFELDAPAGYRLQRRVPAPGVSELVVSLDAVAKPEKIKAGKAMIKGVSIAPEGSKKSVAHIRLSREGLRVKEMILASPPRIVLDVLGPPQKAAASKTAASKTAKQTSAPAAKAKKADSAAKSAAPAATEKAAATRVPKPVRSTPKPVAKPQPAPVVKPTAAAQPPAPKAVEPTKPAAEATALTGGPAAKTPSKKTEASSGTSPVAAVDPAKPPAPTPRTEPQKLAMAKPPVQKPAPTATAGTPPPVRVAKPAPRPPAPPARERMVVPKPTPARSTPPPAAAEGSAFDMKTVGGGLAALALVGLVGFLLMRRRAKHEVLDDDEFEGDPLSADNPFAELGDDLAAGGQTQPKFTDSVDTEAEATSGLQEDLFGAASEEAETGAVPQESGAAGEKMDTLSEMPTTPIMDGGAAMAGAGATAGDDVMSMLRAFEQRISSLETRLAEVSEAKERLERQVAAQTEELRVQRAAIARTQRAVRNLNRPEDEAPTEPALRDPSRPGGPRTDG